MATSAVVPFGAKLTESGKTPRTSGELKTFPAVSKTTILPLVVVGTPVAENLSETFTTATTTSLPAATLVTSFPYGLSSTEPTFFGFATSEISNISMVFLTPLVAKIRFEPAW